MNETLSHCASPSSSLTQATINLLCLQIMPVSGERSRSFATPTASRSLCSTHHSRLVPCSQPGLKTEAVLLPHPAHTMSSRRARGRNQIDQDCIRDIEHPLKAPWITSRRSRMGKRMFRFLSGGLECVNVPCYNMRCQEARRHLDHHDRLDGLQPSEASIRDAGVDEKRGDGVERQNPDWKYQNQAYSTHNYPLFRCHSKQLGASPDADRLPSPDLLADTKSSPIA